MQYALAGKQKAFPITHYCRPYTATQQQRYDYKWQMNFIVDERTTD